ncbi:MAG: high-affinity D-ribose transport protein superfamily, atp bind [Actinomycetota bacterium]|jgi:ribose transport system ATP-binding protein
MGSTLHIHSLSKTFPGQVALRDVALDIEEGEIHALVGQNGSGKSTLIKILAGFHQPDANHVVTMRGAHFEIGNAAAAHAAGIRFVHQDLGLVESVSTVENLALGFGYDTSFGQRIKWRSETKRAKQLLADLGFDINVRAPVAMLGAAERTGVAIARALQDLDAGVSIVVLDEPTAALPGADVDRLFDAVRRLKARGISVIFVSHHLEEVFEIADRVTVLRDGQVVGTKRTSELTMDSLIEMIVGHKVVARSADRSVSAATPPRFVVENLVGPGVNGLSFEVRPGEVLGVTGLTGSGRDTLVGLLSGATPRFDGRVTIDGDEIPNAQPRGAIKRGLAFVPVNRIRNGLLPTMSVRANLTIADVERNKKGWRLSHRDEKAESNDWVSRLSIVTAGTEVPIATLSGGNQQKVMMARSFRLSPKVLLVDEPTQGVDIGAKEEIHSFVDQAADNGAAVVVCSTDSSELARVCDRVLVMYRGEVVETISRETGITAENIDRALLAGSTLAN